MPLHHVGKSDTKQCGNGTNVRRHKIDQAYHKERERVETERGVKQMKIIRGHAGVKGVLYLLGGGLWTVVSGQSQVL